MAACSRFRPASWWQFFVTARSVVGVAAAVVLPRPYVAASQKDADSRQAKKPDACSLVASWSSSPRAAGRVGGGAAGTNAS